MFPAKMGWVTSYPEITKTRGFTETFGRKPKGLWVIKECWRV